MSGRLLLRWNAILIIIVLAVSFGCAEPKGNDEPKDPPGNQDPVLASIPTPRSVVAGNLLSFSVAASDIDGDPITLSTSPLPPNAAFTDNLDGTGDFSFQPGTSQVGPVTVTFRADDGIAAPVTQDVEIHVTVSQNLPPVMTTIPTLQSVAYPDTLSFTVTATDPDGDGVTLTADSLPANASFQDNGDGSADFAFTPDASQIGTYRVRFVATDGINAPVSRRVHILSVGASPIVHVGTAAGDVVVVVIETSDTDPVPDTTRSLWSIDGNAPADVGRYSYVWWEGPSRDGYPMVLRHHIYLVRSNPLVPGRSYDISTPYGDVTLDFDLQATFCESIHVNQVGYFEGSTVRRANLGVFLGDLGSRTLPEPIEFDVIDEESGAVVHHGQASYWGDDTGTTKASGEHVYRMDLASVPAGGPYFISVGGMGRSYAFGIGPTFSREIAFVHARGMYHQRCGIALEAPYTHFTRPECHGTVEVTDAEPYGFITERGPSRSIRGGYHDAGDFDRRLSHIIMPAWLLTLFEAYPERFRDGQYSIPESGNGIPDMLDEALWGVLLYEELQEADGGVRAGTESDAHPPYATDNAATDDLVYRTYRRDGHVTAVSAGIFAQASRLVKPYDPARASELLLRAEGAYGWIQTNDPPSAHAAQRMYASLQLYLATGDTAYHDDFILHEAYLSTAGWPEQYHPKWFNLDTIWDGMIFAPYFFSYIITALPADPSVQARLADEIIYEAGKVVDDLNGTPYPMGPATSPVGYGSATNQGRYAEPVILAYRLTGEAAYLDAASQLADYSMGLNPLGKSYCTGLGANPPPNPLHLDSYFTELAGMGPVPGITVYGPTMGTSGASYQQIVWSQVYPGWDTLPEQRRYSEGWSLVRVQEFTTWETQALNTFLYAFLAGGR